MSSVRVGVAIRRAALEVEFSENVSLFTGPRGAPMALPPGRYRFECAAPANPPRWGARIATYSDPVLATATHDYLRQHGVTSEIIPQGELLQWGPRQLETTVHAVVLGDDPDPGAVLEQARTTLTAVPTDPSGTVPGARRYDDELPRVEAVRLAVPSGGQIRITPAAGEAMTAPSPLRFDTHGTGFRLAGVTIGIDFHWQHDETLAFRGDLDVVADGNALTAVNEVELDDYLASLLGSEMRPDWPEEALKAQAVAARSTVLATRFRHHANEAFHLCHDDHCQCYQGISREGDTARNGLASMPGEILAHGDRVADARYAKTSGVLTDRYDVAWDDEHLGYLVPVPCGPLPLGGQSLNDARAEIAAALAGDGESNLRRWLDSPPDWTACNPTSHPYPPSVSEMADLFIWTRMLSWHQVSDFVQQRIGLDLGNIQRLEPLQRGISGRIIYLRVVGDSGTATVGKELAIRRLLSDSHLPSSAFLIDQDTDGITLRGLGWGHGAGLCQLGAAGLASRGWSAGQILDLFYPETVAVRDNR